MTYKLSLIRVEKDGTEYGITAQLEDLPEPFDLTPEHPVFQVALDRLIMAHTESRDAN